MRKLTFLILLFLLGVLVPGLGIALGGDGSDGIGSQKPGAESVVVQQDITDADDAPRSTATPGEYENRQWTMAIMADMNGPYGSTTYNNHVHSAVAWLVEQQNIDLVVSPGDLVAGQRRGLSFEPMWTAFHEAVTDPLARAGIPLAVSPGNHDASGAPAFWEERIHFVREFERRRPQLSFVDQRFYPFYYAFEVGPALIISLDGTTVGPLDRVQREWVRKTLARNQHKSVRIVVSHVPLFAVAEGREREILRDRELEEIFEEFNVDLMITGHHHAYYPAKRGKTIYLHAAALGDGPRRLVGDDHRSPRSMSLVTFDESGILELDTRLSPRFEESVDLNSLPESITADGEPIYRIDLYNVDRRGLQSRSE